MVDLRRDVASHVQGVLLDDPTEGVFVSPKHFFDHVLELGGREHHATRRGRGSVGVNNRRGGPQRKLQVQGSPKRTSGTPRQPGTRGTYPRSQSVFPSLHLVF